MVKLKQGKDLEQGVRMATTPIDSGDGRDGMHSIDYAAIRRDQARFWEAMVALPVDMEPAELDAAITRTAASCESDECRHLTPDQVRRFIIDYSAS